MLGGVRQTMARDALRRSAGHARVAFTFESSDRHPGIGEARVRSQRPRPAHLAAEFEPAVARASAVGQRCTRAARERGRHHLVREIHVEGRDLEIDRLRRLPTQSDLGVPGEFCVELDAPARAADDVLDTRRSEPAVQTAEQAQGGRHLDRRTHARDPLRQPALATAAIQTVAALIGDRFVAQARRQGDAAHADAGLDERRIGTDTPLVVLADAGVRTDAGRACGRCVAVGLYTVLVLAMVAVAEPSRDGQTRPLQIKR